MGLSPLSRIKCSLHIGTSVIDQPYVRITGYDTIAKGTKVQISVSNIKNLINTK